MVIHLVYHSRLGVIDSFLGENDIADFDKALNLDLSDSDILFLNMLFQAPILVMPQGQFTPLNEVTIPGLIAAAVNLILIVAALLFTFSLLTGGIKMIISGGKTDKMDEAKRQLVNSIVGVFIVFSAWAGMSFISQFYGIDLLTFEIPTL